MSGVGAVIFDGLSFYWNTVFVAFLLFAAAAFCSRQLESLPPHAPRLIVRLMSAMIIAICLLGRVLGAIPWSHCALTALLIAGLWPLQKTYPVIIPHAPTSIVALVTCIVDIIGWIWLSSTADAAALPARRALSSFFLLFVLPVFTYLSTSILQMPSSVAPSDDLDAVASAPRPRSNIGEALASLVTSGIKRSKLLSLD